LTTPHTPGPWRIIADSDIGLHLIWAEDGTSGPGILVARTCFAPASAANAHLVAAAPELLDALSELVWIIDRAGLLNLSNGVQLGPTSWYVKASDRLEAARAVLAKAHPQNSGSGG
jgi:hypothetical protein